MTAIADRYRTLADAFEAKVAGVRAEDWSNPTPCTEWDARDLVAHVVDVHGMMLRPLPNGSREAPSVDDYPLAAFRSARADVERVLDDPAAADTEYHGMFGRTKVSATIDEFMAFDLVVHGWDLARATGQDESIADAEVERIAAFVDRMGTAAMQENGVTGPEVPVPDGASAQDRVLGRLGRRP